MKLSDIKTGLFTRVTKTTFGFRFEVYQKMDTPHNQYYKAQFNMLEDGQVNIITYGNIRLSLDQLKEITRVANILKGENNE